MKKRRKLVNMDDIILSEYIPGMKSWWASLQPAERVVSEGEPLQRQVSEDSDWSPLTKSSKNGFFVFMVALAWWLNLANTPELLVEFESFIDDMNWALTTLLETLPAISGKHSHEDEDEDEQPPRKR